MSARLQLDLLRVSGSIQPQALALLCAVQASSVHQDKATFFDRHRPITPHPRSVPADLLRPASSGSPARLPAACFSFHLSFCGLLLSTDPTGQDSVPFFPSRRPLIHVAIIPSGRRPRRRAVKRLFGPSLHFFSRLSCLTRVSLFFSSFALPSLACHPSLPPL